MNFSIFTVYIVLFGFYTNANNILKLNDILPKYKDCHNFYMKKVYPIQSKRKAVLFEEYLEYWWNTEESSENLLKRICQEMFNKY